jgi:glutamate carboxypeptidase
LVLSHLDTVHPVGLIDEVLPWKREDDHVQGPGIYGTNAGVDMAYYAYQHLVRQEK